MHVAQFLSFAQFSSFFPPGLRGFLLLTQEAVVTVEARNSFLPLYSANLIYKLSKEKISGARKMNSVYIRELDSILDRKRFWLSFVFALTCFHVRLKLKPVSKSSEMLLKA